MTINNIFYSFYKDRLPIIQENRNNDIIIDIPEEIEELPTIEEKKALFDKRTLKICAVALGILAAGVLAGVMGYYAYSYFQETISGPPISPPELPTCLSENDPTICCPEDEWLWQEYCLPSCFPEERKEDKICLFTSFTTKDPIRKAMSEKAVENHSHYAADKKYQYLVYRENLAKQTNPHTGKEEFLEPYWSKIAGLNKLLNAREPSLSTQPEWIVWLDDDALITNPEKTFEEIIKHYAPEGSGINFIVTEDAESYKNVNIPLNSAVLIVKNNNWSRSFFNRVWNLRNEIIKGKNYSYANCPDQSCLHEQQLISELMQKKPLTQEHIRVIPQRDSSDPTGGWGINTFCRWAHMDHRRGIPLIYKDREVSKWKPGDFIGQCTGLISEFRAYCIDHLSQGKLPPFFPYKV